VNYIYKFIMAVVLTPVIWLAHVLIDSYLGEEDAEALKQTAAETSGRLV
jgi:energy-converting hydrogenase Eha subunit B